MQYNFDEFVDRSGTMASKWDARPDLLPLWVADMDLPCAEPIIQALHKRVDRRIFGYTETLTPAYTGAVLGWMERRFGWQPKAEWIRYSAGVIQAQSCLIHMLSKPGDKIIVQKPVYGPFMMSIETQDRVVSNNALVRCGDHYDMDFDDLAARFADPETVGMILCNPHNPVGRVWTASELRRIATLCRTYGVLLLVDEIHADFSWPEHPVTMMGELGDDIARQCIEFTAPTKTFNLAGLLCSNTIIRDPELKTRFDVAAENIGGMTVSHFGLVACIAAYNEAEGWFDELLDVVAANLATVRAFATAHNGIALVEPEGTYLAWLDCRGLGFTGADELRDFMRAKARVYFDEGALFGVEGEGFERVNLACPPSMLADVLERMHAALANR